MSDYRHGIDFVSQSFFKLMSGCITENEFEKLEDILIHDEVARKHYYELNYMSVALKNSEGILGLEEVLSYDEDFWGDMAEYEKTAPEIELPREKPQRELIQKVIYPHREKRRVSKYGIIFLAMNAAAILFFFLFLRFAPPKGGLEVATLTDSINAKWADPSISMQKGARLFIDKAPLLLREGLVAIKFDNNTQITIEGPAEFQILDDDMMKLNYGQLYSQVPAEAYGFQVSTQHAKVIDLGTEFGIKEEFDGDTEVHVLKGQVNLVAGILNKKINIDLLAGSARELNAETGILKEIPCKDNLFARQIDSKSNFIWRGQSTIDLADIVGGGHGYGDGEIGKGIDLINGNMTKRTTVGFSEGGKQFIQIPWSPFIDGVFVPDGDQGSVQVSSMRDEFSVCPDTTGVFFDPIINGGALTYIDTNKKEKMELNGEIYGTKQSPALYLHSNAGITYDLQAIRQANPYGQIRKFKAIGGISKNASAGLSKSDIYILLDGKVWFEATGITMQDTPRPIDIEIDPDVKYLTLISTDGGDGNDLDWVILAKPVLELEIE